MIPKRISHTWVQNPTYINFKKEVLVPFRKILVPFRTTKDCHSCRSLLLVWQIYSLNWDLEIDSFVEPLCSFGAWSSGKVLDCDARWPEFKSQCVIIITFS
jgi:hypothetical protein